jgi:hypothetical protein
MASAAVMPPPCWGQKYAACVTAVAYALKSVGFVVAAVKHHS